MDPTASSVPTQLFEAIREIQREMRQCWVALAALAILYGYYGFYLPQRMVGERIRVAASVRELQLMHLQFDQLRRSYLRLIHWDVLPPHERRAYGTSESIQIFTDVYLPQLRKRGFATLSDSMTVALGLLRNLVEEHDRKGCALCARSVEDTLHLPPLGASDVTLDLFLLCKLRRATVILQTINNSEDNVACRDTLRYWLASTRRTSPSEDAYSSAPIALKASIIESFEPFLSLRYYADNPSVVLDRYAEVGSRLGIARPPVTGADLALMFRDVGERAQQVAASLSPDLIPVPFLNVNIEGTYALIILPLIVLLLTFLLTWLAERRVELLRQWTSHHLLTAADRPLWEAILTIMPRRFDAHSWFRDGFIPRLLAAVILLMPIGFNLLAGATSLGALQGLLRLVCIGLLSLTLAVASWLAWLTFVQSITPQVQLATEVDQEAIVND